MQNCNNYKNDDVDHVFKYHNYGHENNKNSC